MESKPLDKTQIFYDFSSMRFSYLKEVTHNLSSKTIEIFKIIMSITPILLGIGYYLLMTTPSPCALTLFNISVFSFLLTIIKGLSVISPSEVFLTDPYEFYVKYFDLESSDILEQIAVNIGDDCSELVKVLKVKSDNLKSLLIFFIVTLGFLFWAYISLF